MKIVIDVSAYQSVYNFEKFKLLINSGVSAVIIRAGCYYTEDTMLLTFVNWCKQLNVPFSLYWYLYPNTTSTQADKFITVAKKYPENNGLWIDVEEHTGSASFLDGYYKSEFTKVKNAFPDKLVGIYSGGWILNTYIPNMYKWAAQYPYWDAYYVKYTAWWKAYIASLGGTWDSSAKTISIANLKNIMLEIEKHPIVHANGMNTLLWQCITYIPFTELTEGQRHLDFNICTDANFAKLFKVVPGEIMETNAVVTANVLNVRSSPYVNWFNKVGQFVKGERINVESVDENMWGKVTYPIVGYVSMGYVVKDAVVIPPVVPPVVDPMILEKAYRIDELKHRKEEIIKLFDDRIDELS